MHSDILMQNEANSVGSRVGYRRAGPSIREWCGQALQFDRLDDTMIRILKGIDSREAIFFWMNRIAASLIRVFCNETSDRACEVSVARPAEETKSAGPYCDCCAAWGLVHPGSLPVTRGAPGACQTDRTSCPQSLAHHRR